jgi:hypothetical protein
MSIPSDRHNPVDDEPYRGSVIRLHNQRHNLYDDPLDFIRYTAVYRLLFFIADIQSMSVVVFLRYRIGYRHLRLWQILFQLIGVGIFYAFFSLGTTGVIMAGVLCIIPKLFLNIISFGLLASLPLPLIQIGTRMENFRLYGCFMLVYALMLLGVGVIEGQRARELIDHPKAAEEPEFRQLDTMARGDSLLWEGCKNLKSKPLFIPLPRLSDGVMRPVRILPLVIRLPRITDWEWRPIYLFPPEHEYTLQRVWEPLLIVIFAFMEVAIFGDAGFCLWLLLSALCLIFVESDIYVRSFANYLDMMDAEVEAKVQRAINDPIYREQHIEENGKIGGIALPHPEFRFPNSRIIQNEEDDEEGEEPA